jgi:hypothetical protein
MQTLARILNLQKLEDDLATMSAKRAQAEAQTKVLLAKLQRVGTELTREKATAEELRSALQSQQLQCEQCAAERDAALSEAQCAHQLHADSEQR